MVRRARRGADLIPGASLRGIVFDGCYDNRIPNTFGMLRHFGMPNRNRVLVSESPHLNTNGLATALHIDESEILRRRYPPFGRGHRSFYGLHISKHRIEDRVRRFSPAAIAAGFLHHPATHELRDLPFSTVGWDLLQDTCPCTEEGVRQNWVTVNGSSRCHACGGSLGKIPAIPIPDDLRGPLAFIARLVDPDPSEQEAAMDMLPTGIRGASRTLLYDMVMNLARAIGADRDEADAQARIEALAGACDIVMRWPKGLSEITRAHDCPDRVWDWVRRNYAILDADSHVACVSTAPAETNPATHPTYAPSGTAGRIKTGWLGAMAAARLGGVDEQALKRAWDEGRFTQHVWVLGSLRVRAFDPSEVVAVAPMLRVVGSRTIAANYLGLPLYGIEQLLEAELFTPAAPGGGVKQVTAHLDAARALGAEIERAATTVTDTKVSFLDAIRHVSGRPKPWAAAITALLSGSIPFEARASSKGNGIVGRIVVDRGVIPMITAMPHDVTPKVAIERSDRWSGVDALECLNGNRSASDLLIGLESVRTGKKRLYRVTDVLDRVAAGVTTFDLTRRSGVGTTRIVATLEAQAVPQIAPGLWERRRAEELTLAPILRARSGA